MNGLDKNKIDKELRTPASIINFLLPKYTKKKFVIINKVTDLMFKGRALTKKISYSQFFIKREDKSELRLCVYTPKEPVKNAVGLLWIHGGGYAMSVPEQDIYFIKQFVEAENCIVVAPDYTRSVEKPFPAALNDVYLALKWMVTNAKTIGISSSKIFVGGDSAGGGLTAALTLLARDRGEFAIAFQILIYPMLDSRETNSSKNNTMPVWNTKSNRVAWKTYLKNQLKPDKYAVPALETDYSNLPPALSYVGDLDPFLDETKNYVEQLKKHKIKVDFKIFNGCYHVFDVIGKKTRVGKQSKEFLLNGFKYAVNHYSKKQPR